MKPCELKEEDTSYLRSAKTKEERLFAALNSGPDDLFQSTDFRLVVTGVNQDGERLYLGCIDMWAVYEKSFDTVGMIERIKFHPSLYLDPPCPAAAGGTL